MKKINLILIIILLACSSDNNNTEPIVKTYYNCFVKGSFPGKERTFNMRWCEGGIVLDTENYLDVFEGGVGGKGKQLFGLIESKNPDSNPAEYSGIFKQYTNGVFASNISEKYGIPVDVFQSEFRSENTNDFRWRVGRDIGVVSYPDYIVYITNE